MWLAYAITLPPCSRTIPTPTALASVWRENGAALAVNCGNAKIRACVNLSFNWEKALLHAGVHEKGTSSYLGCAVELQYQ